MSHGPPRAPAPPPRISGPGVDAPMDFMVDQDGEQVIGRYTPPRCPERWGTLEPRPFTTGCDELSWLQRTDLLIAAFGLLGLIGLFVLLVLERFSGPAA